MATKTVMFQVKCARPGCENKMYTYAKDMSGNLPVVFCSKRCEGEAAYAKRFKKI